MPAPPDTGNYNCTLPADLRQVLRHLAGVLADAKQLDPSSRIAFAHTAEAMLVRHFGGELVLIEAERYLAEAS